VRLFESREEKLATLFDDIVGLGNVKDVVVNAALSPHPVSVLLVGPPQSAKTLILEKLATYYGFNYGVPYTFDARVTAVGLARFLFNHRNSPAFIFDELDKARREVLNVFNEAVESRRVTFLNARTTGVVSLNRSSKFFCGSNSERVLEWKASATASRFLRVRIPAYDRDLFIKVMLGLLTRKEYGGYSAGEAGRIAAYAWDREFRDIRQLRELCKVYPRTGDRSVEKVLGFIDYNQSIQKR
jgi:MoxR-like ATPase